MGSCELVFSSYIAQLWIWGTVVELYVFLYFFCSVFGACEWNFEWLFCKPSGVPARGSAISTSFVFVVEALSRMHSRSVEGGHLFGFSIKRTLIQR